MLGWARASARVRVSTAGFGVGGGGKGSLRVQSLVFATDINGLGVGRGWPRSTLVFRNSVPRRACYAAKSKQI